MVELAIDFDQKKEELGDLYGLFFEDLNHAADGGLYAEMIQNRSFEYTHLDNDDYHPLYGWQDGNGDPLTEVKLQLRVLSDDPLHLHNRHYLKVNSREARTIANDGYNQGLFFEAGESYDFSCFAKPDLLQQRIQVGISYEGEVPKLTELAIDGRDWQEYHLQLTAEQTTKTGKLVVVFPELTDLAIDMISLFPVKTFKNRPNGCRKDIAEMLAAMKPKFMRFPGGCLVHDGSLNANDHDSMYRWKNTVGPVAFRPTKRNNWGYNQSLGLGFYEYFLLCEDLGAEPLPVLPAGWDPHHQRAVPLAEMGEWIQDALDLIEFANGSTDTTWGALREEMGHPEPFNMSYLGIGNEEVGQQFFDRYDLFHEALKKAHPEIKLINSSGPFAAGSEYDRGWANAKKNHSDLVDEHFYSSPSWFIAHHHRYDNIDPAGPKVFLGEYATKDNKWWNALAEASFMIGLERNAAKVGLACYAPMLTNVAHVNWAPDMIWYDQAEVYGTVNYTVQKLFTEFQGTQNVGWTATDLPADAVWDDRPITGACSFKGDGAEIRISEIFLLDNETGQQWAFPDMTISNDEELPLQDIQSEDYQLHFRFTKTGGQEKKGFKLNYGKLSDDDRYIWSLGGWENQDCMVESIKEGYHTVLTQNIWHVETGVSYDCLIKIKGRQIQTSVDGVVFNETEDLPVVAKPLYINTVYDEKLDRYIAKLVNLQPEPQEITVTTGEVEKVISYSGEKETVATMTNKQPLTETVLTDGNATVTVPAQGISFVIVKDQTKGEKNETIIG